MIVSIVLALPFIVLAIVFLVGKGDRLIAGYNTASDEERLTVNIHRLRLLMAIMSLLTASYCGVLPFIGNDALLQLATFAIFLVLTIIFIILANTWAKKK